MNLVLFAVVLVSSAPNVNILRWVSPDRSVPTNYREFVSKQPLATRWQIRQLSGPVNRFDQRVDILIQDSLVNSLNPSLDTLRADLENEGYAVALFSVTGTSPESLRAFLRREYQDSGLTTAVLIGNLPVPWFQLIDDWNNNQRRDPDEGYEEFPCDLLLMDLDGVWLDTLVRLDTLDSLIPGTDGIYDTHTGNVEPEIGISRIYTSTISPNVSLIQEYLARCHFYRTGQLTVFDRALTYIDDDWTPWAEEWNTCVGYLYPQRVFIADSEQTRVRDYKPRIDTAAYQWIQLCAHSWPGGHAMKYNHGQSWDWFYAESIPRINPNVCFYNLFACSNVRFIESNYCGGRYVFQSNSGLGAIGSTKTGSMLEFQDFYLPLSNGASMAGAFKQWFAIQAQDGFEPWEKSWFYGMCLIGDGTLKPRASVAIAENEPAAPNFAPVPTIIRRNQQIIAEQPRLLFDRSGRFIRRLNIGTNQFTSLPAGVYFLKSGLRRPVQPLILID